MDYKKDDTTIKLIGQGKAKVLAVKSTEEQHVVKVFHPDLGVTEFIPYIQTAGLYRPPRVGDACYVFCDENFQEYPIAWGHRMSKKTIAQLVGKREDNITVIYSSGSKLNSITHKIELDDGEDNGIRITTDGNNQVELKDTEDITVRHNTGSLIRVNAQEIFLTVQGTTLKMNQQGLFLESAQGGKTEITADVNTESANGGKVSTTDSVTSESSAGSKLEVGSGIEGEAADANSKFDQVSVPKHRHPGNLGFPTSPPIKSG